MVSSPARTLGQNLIHSWAHRFGVHRSFNTIAILISAKTDKMQVLKRFFGSKILKENFLKRIRKLGILV
jgi:hypothetical protein